MTAVTVWEDLVVGKTTDGSAPKGQVNKTTARGKWAIVQWTGMVPIPRFFLSFHANGAFMRW